MLPPFVPYPDRQTEKVSERGINNLERFYPSPEMEQGVSLLNTFMSTPNNAIRALNQFRELREQMDQSIQREDESLKTIDNFFTNILGADACNAVLAFLYTQSRHAYGKREGVEDKSTEDWESYADELYRDLAKGKLFVWANNKTLSILLEHRIWFSKYHHQNSETSRAYFVKFVGDVASVAQRRPMSLIQILAMTEDRISTPDYHFFLKTLLGSGSGTELDRDLHKSAASSKNNNLVEELLMMKGHLPELIDGHKGEENEAVANESIETSTVESTTPSKSKRVDLVDLLADVPEVRPVKLPSLKKSQNGWIKKRLEKTIVGESNEVSSLESFKASLLPLSLSYPSMFARQKAIEESGAQQASARWLMSRELEASPGRKLQTSLENGGEQLRALTWQWLQDLEQDLTFEVAQLHETEKDDQSNKHPISAYLNLISPKSLATVTILECLRGCTESDKHARLTPLANAIGSAVEIEYYATMVGKKEIRKLDSEFRPFRQDDSQPDRSAQPDGSLVLTKQSARLPRVLRLKDLYERHVTDQEIESSEQWHPEWTKRTKVTIGTWLLERVLQVVKFQRVSNDETGNVVTEIQPAFVHFLDNFGGMKVRGVIQLQDQLLEKMAHTSLATPFQPQHVPMVCKPLPWKRHNSGAYLVHRTKVVRTKDYPEQTQYLKQSDGEGKLKRIYEALDHVGSTGWKINPFIFNFALGIWNSGKGFADIPGLEESSRVVLQGISKTPRVMQEESQARLDTFQEQLGALNEEASTEALKAERIKEEESMKKYKSEYYEKMRAAHMDRIRAYGERCGINYQLEVARAFSKDVFYLPHNLDFRGRAYPIPPYLSPVGDDLSRGLLMFAEAKPLGEQGLRWLKIHIANKYGYDKVSLDDRAVWTDEHMAEIRDSVGNPQHGGKFWLQADDPWQFLAASHDLLAALASPNPLEYPSAIPVHQDGSCNGMQHYAALGGDVDGAISVNLSKGPIPADVYSRVARMVQGQVSKDLEHGNEKIRNLARLIDGKITRKVVKQTVMTTVYGVTMIGAKEQIARQLDAIKLGSRSEINEAASYLAKTVMGQIGTLFKGAKDIQNWLTICSKIITKSISLSTRSRLSETQLREQSKKSTGSPLIWDTPLGLPVVQPYRKAKVKMISTKLQGVNISDPYAATNIDSVKQTAAFPPNFIHSLDATHMMLTALKAKNAGVAFASVHDSYWTHAADIPKLNESLRESFVELHKSDILGLLKENMVARYNGYHVHEDVVKKLNKWKTHVGSNLPLLNLSNLKKKPLMEQARIWAELKAVDFRRESEFLDAQARYLKRLEEWQRGEKIRKHNISTNVWISSSPYAQPTPKPDPIVTFKHVPLLISLGKAISTNGEFEVSEETWKDPESPFMRLVTKSYEQYPKGLKLLNEYQSVDEAYPPTDFATDLQAMGVSTAGAADARKEWHSVSDLLPDPPVRGPFNVEEVRESPYFFS